MNSKRTVRPFVLGVLLTDEWAASPNMGETTGDGVTKAARMKFIRTSEGNRTILSGQAVGSWHRKTLYDRFGWPVSELQETISDRDSRSFYTQCQPIEYAEDDGRGYMAAVTVEEKIGDKDEKMAADKERKKKFPLTTKRTSPFMLSQFQSAAPNVRMNDWGILARNLDDLPDEVKGGLIFRAEVAAAAYAGLFALNVSELGVFTVGVGRDLLPFSDLKDFITREKRALYKKDIDQLSEREKQILDTLKRTLKRCVDAKRGEVLALNPGDRRERAHDLISALADLEGGAHMTRRLYNVAPSTALIAFMNGGNCLQPHIIRATVRDEDDYGNKTYKFIVDLDRLHKVLWDNKDRLLLGEKVKGKIWQKKQSEADTDRLVERECEASVFFGTLGAPSIENEGEVLTMLSGLDESRPLPSEIKCLVFDGPRQAIRAAAAALPLEWFELPQNAKRIDDVIYGEKLIATDDQEN